MGQKTTAAKTTKTVNNAQPASATRSGTLFRRSAKTNEAEKLSRLVCLSQDTPTVRSTFPIQAAMQVSMPADPAEKEAERKAKKVMRLAVADGPVTVRTRATGRLLTRVSPAGTPKEERVQKKGEGQSSVQPATEAAIKSSMTGGSPLPTGVRRFMEPRFDADFKGVRVHTGTESAKLNRKLNAQAFTVGRHIFFGRDRFRPESAEGRELIAHELTHTVQQGAAVQRRAEAPVSRRSPIMVQRLGISDALDYFADKANMIPGFRMFTIILGVNPINMGRVERNAANILRAVIEMIPGGGLITQALDSSGVFERAGAWVEQQIGTLGMTGSVIKDAIDRFLDSLSWRDVFRLGDVWNRAKRIFTEPIDRIISFVKGLVNGIIKFVKDAILRPLARLAQGTRGYDLLKAVLGEDPITGEPVPRTADTLIGGFMKLIGQEEVWENIKKGNAAARAWAWFQGALAGLLGFVRTIPKRIIDTITSLTIQDIVTVAGAFTKVVGAFVNIAADFINWGLNQVIGLLEILFSVVAPGVMPYIKKAQTAFVTIIKNPIGFVGNLVRAGKMGFQMFASRILEHLKAALIKWLVGPLGDAGVYIPKSFSLLEILKLVLSVFGLTWQNIRAKLVKIIPEPVLAGLEKTAHILVTLVKDGPAAAWQEIKAELNELKDQLISQITQMVSIEVVKAAVIKLASMLNPAGAVIQAIIAIYNTITFFIQKINQIAAVVASFIDSVAAIAAGQVANAAKKVEQTMANTLVVVIGFLAKFIGLGNVPAKLVGIIKKIRQPIDKALDRIVAWLGGMLKKLGGAVKAGARAILQWWKKKVPVNGGGEKHTLTFEGSSKNARLVLRSTPEKPSEFLNKAAQQRKVGNAKSKGPIAQAVSHEKNVDGLQKNIGKYEETVEAAAGDKTKEANELMGKLDSELGLLSMHIVTTLDDWGVADAEIKGVTLPRGSFSIEQKKGIARQHTNEKDIVKDSKGRLVNLREGLARRHVVSSHDMARHYEDRLNGKKISEGKLLLEQRASIGDARIPVEDVSQSGIQKAAKTRYSRFFGYLRNMFIGDSRENSSIQELIDKGHPEMVGSKLQEHVAHIKRTWAFDKDMTISGLDEK